MKNLIHDDKKVLAYYDATKNEKLSIGAQKLFSGTDKECRRKAKELELDIGEFDLAFDVVPRCSPRQIRLWLLSLGVTEDMILAKINTIADATEKAKTLIEFKYAIEFDRNHPFVDVIGAALGLTDTQIDAGFRLASKL